MTYVYDCSGCSKRFEVYKSVKDMERNENCPKCGEFGMRRFIPERVSFTGTKVQNAEYNPGLGCIVKNAKERAEIAKRKGLVEIGNDYQSGEAHQKAFDTERARKREKEWEDL